MIRWEKIDYEYSIVLSGEQQIGSTIQLQSGSWGWQIFDEQESGEEPTEEAAKAAAESAFREWMERAGVTVIPPGWKLVPEEPTPEIIDGWLIACCSSWLSANVAREMYRLLMGAIRERGPKPDHFRGVTKMVDSQVLKHHETFDADMAEVRDVLRDTPKNPEVAG